MEHYILLITLTPEGQAKTLEDPEHLLRVQESITLPGVEILGLYGVLGQYDFVCMVEAPDNDAAARFSLELGVRAGVHVATLPAIPIARLEAAANRDVAGLTKGVAMPEPK